MCNAPIYDYFKKSKEAIKFITTHACKEGARAGVRVTELVFVLGPDPSVSHPDPGQESGEGLKTSHCSASMRLSSLIIRYRFHT